MSHPSTARLSLANGYRDPGWGGVGLAGGHHIHCGSIGSRYSIALRGQQLESSTIPLRRGWHGCRWGAGPSFGPPKPRGMFIKPFSAGQEPSGNPFPTMFLQFKVLFGRKNSSPKSLDNSFSWDNKLLCGLDSLIYCASKAPAL